ncbi:MAG: HD domain-containing phosphohydrolase [Nitrospirota bacterium]|nr:HD domain-containing phosphohydrolase [Nitrospirota bacterium]
MAKINPESDLFLTIQELSNAYEELALLYRISEGFSLLSIDEVCSRIVEAVIDTIGVKTSAVVLLDEKAGKFYTKARRGDWNIKSEFGRDAEGLWKAIETKKYQVYCSSNGTAACDYFPGLSRLMIYPLIGKTRVIGAVIIADKENDEEFYSNDSKLLMAISVQAGLSIENALLHSEIELLLIGAIRSLVKALEAASGWTAGHTERVTEYAIAIAGVMGLDAELIEKLKITSLLHDIGKIATPREILNKKGKLKKEEMLIIKKHPEQGAAILSELQQFEEIILSIKYHHEYWDGSGGIFGLMRGEIPVMARILAVADTFDALTSERPYRHKKTKEEAVTEISRCSGTQFDPDVVDAFFKWISRTDSD